MIKILVRAAVLATAALTAAANAQTPVPAPNPQQDDRRLPAPPTSRLNLTMEQRHTIREQIKDLKVEPTKTAVHFSRGDAVPPNVALRPIPVELGQKVPQIRTHSFVLADDQIAIVDPKDNKVAEVIDLKQE
jgi:Protein of unknown function (DUF1236)